MVFELGSFFGFASSLFRFVRPIFSLSGLPFRILILSPLGPLVSSATYLRMMDSMRSLTAAFALFSTGTGPLGVSKTSVTTLSLWSNALRLAELPSVLVILRAAAPEAKRFVMVTPSA